MEHKHEIKSMFFYFVADETVITTTTYAVAST